MINRVYLIQCIIYIKNEEVYVIRSVINIYSPWFWICKEISMSKMWSWSCIFIWMVKFVAELVYYMIIPRDILLHKIASSNSPFINIFHTSYLSIHGKMSKIRQHIETINFGELELDVQPINVFWHALFNFIIQDDLWSSRFWLNNKK